MKVAVITRHAVQNYGSLLQAFATQQVIEALGHTCEVVDYVRDDESIARMESTLLRRKPQWYAHPLKRWAYLALRRPESMVAGWRFNRERNKWLHLSKRYHSLEQLKTDKPQADLYMTGSDQVWGPVADGSDDSAYCLSFTAPADRRIAYAASFGRPELTEGQCVFFREYLKTYRAITVREQSGVGIIESLGLSGKQVLDPTLLIDAHGWDRYIDKAIHGRYVLIYQLHNDPLLSRYAKCVAKQKKLPLLRISAAFHQISRGGRMVWAPRAGAFLALVKHAECLITDSFHGTVFALLFHTPFVDGVVRNSTENRIVSLLEMTQLTSRILPLPHEEYWQLADVPIDFGAVDRILAQKRAESLRILRQMLAGEALWPSEKRSD